MKNFVVNVALLSFIISCPSAHAISISELPASNQSNYAPSTLEKLDYFTVIPRTRQWWTFLDNGFGEASWQHAGLYSGSDRYGSKSIMHALGFGLTVQETPASYFLKYATERVVWFNHSSVNQAKRNNATTTLRNNIVNRVYYSDNNLSVITNDPDDISLYSPTAEDSLYCSQLVYKTYTQLLGSPATSNFSARPITPKELVDSASFNEVEHHYHDRNFDTSDILPGFGPIGSTRTGSISDNNDEDWWALQLEPNKTYVFETSSSGSGVDTVLYLYRVCKSCPTSMFTKVKVDDDGGSGRYSKVEFKTPRNIPDMMEYYVKARGYNDSTGSYKLKVSEKNTSSSTTPTALQYIDKCIAAFPRHFGNKVDSHYSCGQNNFYCQKTAGGDLGDIIRIAVHKQLSGNKFHYYWGGWSSLSLDNCD